MKNIVLERYKNMLVENNKYLSIMNDAIENAEEEGFDYDFILYLKNFYKNIHKDIDNLNKYVPYATKIDGIDITIHKWDLSGSFSKGNPTPDSDVDLKVYYSGDIDRIDVAMHFAGNIGGQFGSYDCHAVKIEKL